MRKLCTSIVAACVLALIPGLGSWVSAESAKVGVVGVTVDASDPSLLNVTLHNVTVESAPVKVTSKVLLTNGLKGTVVVPSVTVPASTTITIQVPFTGSIQQPLQTITDDLDPV